MADYGREAWAALLVQASGGPDAGKVAWVGAVDAVASAQTRGRAAWAGALVIMAGAVPETEDRMVDVVPWSAVRASVEVVVGGVGQTGLSPTAAVQRLSDGYWLAAGGGAWGAAFASNPMDEVDGANLPGLYEYAVPLARLSYAQGRAGYRVLCVEAANSKRAHRLVYAEESPWEEARADHNGGGTFGAGVRLGPGQLADVEDSLFRLLGTRQENTRIVNTAWSSTAKQPTAGIVLVYSSAADLAADVEPWALAAARYEFAAVYSGGLLAAYTSRRVL